MPTSHLRVTPPAPSAHHLATPALPHPPTAHPATPTLSYSTTHPSAHPPVYPPNSAITYPPYMQIGTVRSARPVLPHASTALLRPCACHAGMAPIYLAITV